MPYSNTIAQPTPRPQSSYIRTEKIDKKNAVLGKDANIVATSKNDAIKKRKYSNLNLLSYAQKLLIENEIKSNRSGNIHRTRLCHACRSGNADTITVKISDNPADKLATLSGVQTCGSVWACPVCSRRIAVQRGREIGYTIDKMEATGHIPLMMTNTASHKKDTYLPAFINKFGKAWRTFTQSRRWRVLKAKLGIKHSIKAIESTHNDANGFHHHQHGVLFAHINAVEKLTDTEMLEWQDDCIELWQHCLKKHGLYGSDEHALKINVSGDVKKDYLAKLGMGEDDTTNLDYEITAGANKSYKGRTVWQILSSARQGNEDDAKLYIEYVQAYDGKNWITYSRGLKDLVELEEMPEEKASLSENDDLLITEPLLDISDYDYVPVRYYRAYSELLEISASTRDADTVKQWLKTLRQEYNTTEAGNVRLRQLAQYTALDNKLANFRQQYNKNQKSDYLPQDWSSDVQKWKELRKVLNIR